MADLEVSIASELYWKMKRKIDELTAENQSLKVQVTGLNQQIGELKYYRLIIAAMAVKEGGSISIPQSLLVGLSSDSSISIIEDRVENTTKINVTINKELNQSESREPQYPN